jgi:hypothetical protein
MTKLFLLALACLPLQASFTTVQSPSGSVNCTGSTALVCASNSLSATTAGHIGLGLLWFNGAATTINGACTDNGTGGGSVWKTAGSVSSSVGGTNTLYVISTTSLASGVTLVSCPISITGNGRQFQFVELSSSIGNVVVDVFGSSFGTPGADTFTAVPLTLTGANDAILVGTSNTGPIASSISSPYALYSGAQRNSGLAINTSSGSAPTWTFPSSVANYNAIAIAVSEPPTCGALNQSTCPSTATNALTGGIISGTAGKYTVTLNNGNPLVFSLAPTGVRATYISNMGGGFAGTLYWADGSNPTGTIVGFRGEGWGVSTSSNIGCRSNGSTDTECPVEQVQLTGYSVLVPLTLDGPTSNNPVQLQNAQQAIWWAAANMTPTSGSYPGQPNNLMVYGSSSGSWTAFMLQLARGSATNPPWFCASPYSCAGTPNWSYAVSKWAFISTPSYVAALSPISTSLYHSVTGDAQNVEYLLGGTCSSSPSQANCAGLDLSGTASPGYFLSAIGSAPTLFEIGDCTANGQTGYIAAFYNPGVCGDGTVPTAQQEVPLLNAWSAQLTGIPSSLTMHAWATNHQSNYPQGFTVNSPYLPVLLDVMNFFTGAPVTGSSSSGGVGMAGGQ